MKVILMKSVAIRAYDIGKKTARRSVDFSKHLARNLI